MRRRGWPYDAEDRPLRWVVTYRAAPSAAQGKTVHVALDEAVARFDDLRGRVVANRRGDVRLEAERASGLWPLGRVSRGMAPRVR